MAHGLADGSSLDRGPTLEGERRGGRGPSAPRGRGRPSEGPSRAQDATPPPERTGREARGRSLDAGGASDRPYVFCNDVFKIYKVADLEVVALRGLDLKVDAGEVIAIVGASGSGKSTLLNILAGYDTPSAGTVFVGEYDLLNMTSREVVEYRRREVGFVWQQTARNLFGYLSAQENVELPMMLAGVDGAVRRRRAERLLDMVGLGHRGRHKPEHLSGGEQQRVAIAVALSNQPPLLLADEPTGELDDETGAEILALLNELNAELGTTIVVVTHDPAISSSVERAIAIRDGKTSTEIRRTAMGNSRIGGETAGLREFLLVDGAGRVQIPREVLDQLEIEERMQLDVRNGHASLRRAEPSDVDANPPHGEAPDREGDEAS